MAWRSGRRGSLHPFAVRSWRGVLWLVAGLALWAVASTYLVVRKGELLSGYASVVDGDTLKIGGVSIRLEGLDAPELRQTCTRDGGSYRCGETARAALDALTEGRWITCRIDGRDRYRRSLAQCSVEGRDLGADLVARGLAVSYHGGRYRREEAKAKEEGLGLWAGTFATPADWRKEHRPPGRS